MNHGNWPKWFPVALLKALRYWSSFLYSEPLALLCSDFTFKRKEEYVVYLNIIKGKQGHYWK